MIARRIGMSVIEFEKKWASHVKDAYYASHLDYPQIAEKWYKMAIENGGDLDDVTAKYQNREKSPKNNFFLYVEGDKMGGMVALKYLSDTDCELCKMLVVPEMRGKKVASKLMNHFIEYSKQQGYKRIELTTSSFVKSGIALYQSYGFVEYKRETHPEYYVDNVAYDVISFELKL